MLYDTQGRPIQGTGNTVQDEAKAEAASLEAHKGKPILGPDEERLLAALRKKVEAGDKNEAPYKLEVMFGSGRTPSGPNNCVITIWETGRFKGGADEIMHWCGHDTCRMPIRGAHLAHFHVVCPHCQQESFVSPDAKMELIRIAKKNKMDWQRLEALPILTPEYSMYNAPTKLIAERCAMFWRRLGSLADLMIKYSPRDIRAYDVPDHQRGDAFNDARIARNTHAKALRYRMMAIHRDIGNGADLTRRFRVALAA